MVRRALAQVVLRRVVAWTAIVGGLGLLDYELAEAGTGGTASETQRYLPRWLWLMAWLRFNWWYVPHIWKGYKVLGRLAREVAS